MLTMNSSPRLYLKNNISVPEKVKIIGFDGISVSKYCFPAITTIFQDKKTALKSADLLLNLIEGEYINSSQHFVLPVSLIERGTT